MGTRLGRMADVQLTGFVCRHIGIRLGQEGTGHQGLHSHREELASTRHFLSEKKSKFYLTPKPFFFLDSFLYSVVWAHRGRFFSVKTVLFSHLNNFMGLWDFSCSSYIHTPIYYVNIAEF